MLPNKEGVFRLMTGTTTSLACRSAQQQPTSTRVGSLLVISKVLGSKRREIFFYSLLDDEEREEKIVKRKCKIDHLDSTRRGLVCGMTSGLTGLYLVNCWFFSCFGYTPSAICRPYDWPAHPAAAIQLLIVPCHYFFDMTSKRGLQMFFPVPLIK